MRYPTDEELEAQVELDIESGGGQAAFDEWLQSTGQTPEDALDRALVDELVPPRQLNPAIAEHVERGQSNLSGCRQILECPGWQFDGRRIVYFYS